MQLLLYFNLSVPILNLKSSQVYRDRWHVAYLITIHRFLVTHVKIDFLNRLIQGFKEGEREKEKKQCE